MVVIEELDVNILRQIFEHNKALLAECDSEENSDIECSVGFMADELLYIEPITEKVKTFKVFEFLK